MWKEKRILVFDKIKGEREMEGKESFKKPDFFENLDRVVQVRVKKESYAWMVQFFVVNVEYGYLLDVCSVSSTNDDKIAFSSFEEIKGVIKLIAGLRKKVFCLIRNDKLVVYRSSDCPGFEKGDEKDNTSISWTS